MKLRTMIARTRAKFSLQSAVGSLQGRRFARSFESRLRSLSSAVYSRYYNSNLGEFPSNGIAGNKACRELIGNTPPDSSPLKLRSLIDVS